MKNSTAKNHRLFHVKYIGATNTRGSRVKINDLRFQRSKTIPYNHEHNCIADMAEDYLESRGIKCDIIGEADSLKGYILGTTNFQEQI